MLSKERLNINYTKFVESFSRLGVDFSQMNEKYGELIKNAPATKDYKEGLAYNGALVYFNGWKLSSWAVALNEKLPEALQVNKQKLLKVACLFQLAKSVMFVESADDWKQKRGIMYDFRDLDSALRCGERTVLMCMQNGISIDETEYEALTILDKLTVNDGLVAHVSPMTTIIRSAYDMAMMECRLKLNEPQA